MRKRLKKKQERKRRLEEPHPQVSGEASGQGRRTEQPAEEAGHGKTREGRDQVDEAGHESFPASDPPSFTPER